MMLFLCFRRFEASLSVHMKIRPLRKGAKKPKAIPHRSLPAWQRDLTRAVEEMAKYAETDMDVEEDEEDEEV